jgi:hypothetical protein
MKEWTTEVKELGLIWLCELRREGERGGQVEMGHRAIVK